MNNVFYIGATGLAADQTAVDVVANNIANMNTAAFKRGKVAFSEMLTTPVNPLAPVTASTPAGVAADASLHVFTQGDLRPTGNALDVAVRGDGFIELQAPNGQALLWRGGTLHVGVDGYLAAPNGLPLKAMISVPADASGISITPAGVVQAMIPNQGALDIGQIDLTVANDTRALNGVGEGLFKIDDDNASLSRVRPGDDNAGEFAQGFSEASNVQLSDELVSLMLYQRAYAANARLVQVGDELMTIANGLKR